MKKGLLILFSLYICFHVFASVGVGAERFDEYLPLIKGKKVALVVNQTSVVGNTHLLDTLLSLKVDVVKIFAPEHGFRGDADAGAHVSSSVDAKTGLPLVSIYGKNKKPSEEQLQDVDVVIFDIQDVGARFYTYISTMHYVMEACAENNKKVVVLDRPNPNDYVDGPVIKEDKYKSFVGMHNIPVLHGCTVGELAQMINGEGWLKNGVKADLTVVKMTGWKHGDKYSLPVKPSPNLPNDVSIQLYPSLCLFEGTAVSVGRGTYFPFQVIGYPDKNFGKYTFTPEPIKGMDTNPVQKGELCYGYDLREAKTEGFSLEYITDFYKKSEQGAKFFTRPQFFDKLAGNSTLRWQIINGKTEQEIRESWQADLNKYMKMREKYLLY